MPGNNRLVMRVVPGEPTGVTRKMVEEKLSGLTTGATRGASVSSFEDGIAAQTVGISGGGEGQHELVNQLMGELRKYKGVEGCKVGESHRGTTVVHIYRRSHRGGGKGLLLKLVVVAVCIYISMWYVCNQRDRLV